MRLSSFTIQNFRSISNEQISISFENSNVIFLFGQNNSGKSTILTAYEYLVTPNQTANIEDFHLYSTDNSIIFYADFKKETSDEIVFKEKGLDKWVDSKGYIKFRKKWDGPEKPGQKETFDPVENKYSIGGFKGLESHFAKHAPTPLRIPAMPTSTDLAKWTSDFIKKTVLSKLKSTDPDLYDRIISNIKDFYSIISSNAELASMNLNINDCFSKVFPELKLLICPPYECTPDISKLLSGDFSITVENAELGNIQQEYTLYGHGVIRQAMFNCLGALKNIVKTELDDEDGKKYLILFEEPEVYLHPKKIFLLRDTLYSLCDESPFQILCSSHSPLLIDISRKHTSLVRLSRNPNGILQKFQAGDDVFGATEEIKQKVQMINRFNPHICESFFADDVILVEGDTEAIIIRELLYKLGKYKDIFVLNTGSKSNIPFFQKILTHFNINYHVIHDSDTKWLYDSDNQLIKNKDGSNRQNPAWKLNNVIWQEINLSIEKGVNADRRVFINNFEKEHGYEYDPQKGKPLSAYEFAQSTDRSTSYKIKEFI